MEIYIQYILHTHVLIFDPKCVCVGGNLIMCCVFFMKYFEALHGVLYYGTEPFSSNFAGSISKISGCGG